MQEKKLRENIGKGDDGRTDGSLSFSGFSVFFEELGKVRSFVTDFLDRLEKIRRVLSRVWDEGVQVKYQESVNANIWICIIIDWTYKTL